MLVERLPTNPDYNNDSKKEDDDDDDLLVSRRPRPSAALHHDSLLDHAPEHPVKAATEESRLSKGKEQPETAKTWLSREGAVESRPDDDGETHEDAEDTEEFAESVEALATLDPYESAMVVKEYTEERLPVVEQELITAELDSPSAHAAAADKLFLEKVADLDTLEAETAEQTINQAAISVAQELDLPIIELQHQLTDSEIAELASDTMAMIEVEPGSSNYESDSLANADEVAVSPVAPANETAAPSVAPVHAYKRSGSGATRGQVSGGGNGGSGGSTTLGGASTNGFNSGFGSRSPFAPNTLTSAARSLTDTERQRAHARGFSQGFVTGGLLGYLYGRRRGRINTEKKMATVRDRLEEQVTTVQEIVLQKELQIRKLAAQKAAAEQALSHPAFPETKTEAKSIPTPAIEAVAETASLMPIKVAAEIGALQAMTQEEQQPPKQPEQHDKLPDTTTARMPNKTVEKEVASQTPESITQLPLAELLTVADTIVIEGHSLKSLFQRGQIEQPALRRVIIEQIRSGRGSQQFAVELQTSRNNSQPSFEKQNNGASVKDKTAQKATSSQTGNQSNSKYASQPITSSAAASILDNQKVNNADSQPTSSANQQHAQRKAIPVRIASGSAVVVLLLAVLLWFIVK